MSLDAALGRLGIKPGVCTSSTRPANPYSGQVIYETDTNNIRFWSGSAWESNKGGIISSSAPTGAAAGDIWYDSDDGRTYIYYDDGSSQQWVEFGAPPVQHGKILQVVSTTKTDAFSTSGGGASITGLTATITPTSATSKIFVSYTITVSHDTPATAGPFGNLRRQVSGLSGVNIYQGSFGSVANRSNFVRRFFGTDENTYNFTGEILDTPATTSAVTYDYVIGTVGTGTTYVNRPANATAYGLASTITVMEVSA